MGDLQNQLETLRATIAKVKAERPAIDAAPVPAVVLAARVRETVAFRAERFAREAFTIFGNARPRAFGLGTVSHLLQHGHTDLLDAACFLDPEKVAERAIEALAPDADAAALDDDERTAQLTELDDRLMALEVQEEEIVQALERSGQDVVRRPDASVAAVLGLERATGTTGA